MILQWFSSSVCLRMVSPRCLPHLCKEKGFFIFPPTANKSYCAESNKCWSTYPEWILWRAAGRRWRVVLDSWGGFHWSLLHTAHNSSGLNRKLRSHSELCPGLLPTVPPRRSPPATPKQKILWAFSKTKDSSKELLIISKIFCRHFDVQRGSVRVWVPNPVPPKEGASSRFNQDQLPI